MRPESGAELIGLIVALAVASLVMVHAMIKWTAYLFAESIDAAGAGRRRWWGVAYGALWVVIIGLFLRLMQRDGRLTWGNLGMLALVAGSFWVVHGLIVWFARAMLRANARAAAAAPTDDGADAEAEEEEEAEREATAAAEAQPAAAAPPGHGATDSKA